MTLWKPPERIKVWEWADKNRTLTSESSAEPGPWRSDRTPYMIPIMEAFTDSGVERIIIMASAQVGKSEMLNNCFGYVVDNDPGPILWIQPTVEAGEDYSKQRIDSMIRNTPSIQVKIAPEKSRGRNNTILKKAFVGGSLSITGSNAPAGLRSKPIRYVFGDELDAWAMSAGNEGNPLMLAERRTETFFNRKIVVVSTPTVKGRSRIGDLYRSGTQEEWCLPCPDCGTHAFIHFDDILFEKETTQVGTQTQYTVTSVRWVCRACGALHTERKMKRQRGRMIARNPEALERGIRSFRLNAWVSPWMSWSKIVEEFLYAQKDPLKLQVVYNTLFGEEWEDRGELEDEETIMGRREAYGADLPPGVLVLTCGVDTQDNRLEYEIVGHGRYGETWGIKKGIIMGRPDDKAVWAQLDDVLGATYHYADGKRGLTISMTCIDSGGHYTQEVYRECRARQNRRVFAIKGQGGDGIPFTKPPTQTKIVIDGAYIGQCWLYMVGVDAGKAAIISSLKVQEPGPKYCHFPLEEERGYDAAFFNGLLSERLVRRRSGNRERWVWEKLQGHARNEALDCRNYAMAALRILDPNMEAVENRLRSAPIQRAAEAKRTPKRKRADGYDDW